MRPVVRGVRDGSEYSNGVPAVSNWSRCRRCQVPTWKPTITAAEQAARDELSAYTLTARRRGLHPSAGGRRLRRAACDRAVETDRRGLRAHRPLPPPRARLLGQEGPGGAHPSRAQAKAVASVRASRQCRRTHRGRRDAVATRCSARSGHRGLVHLGLEAWHDSHAQVAALLTELGEMRSYRDRDAP